MPSRTWQQATKQMPCRTCKEPMTVGIRTKKEPQHLECSAANMADAIRQMHARSGPRYEKFLANRWPAEKRKGGATPKGEATG